MGEILRIIDLLMENKYLRFCSATAKSYKCADFEPELEPNTKNHNSRDYRRATISTQKPLIRITTHEQF